MEISENPGECVGERGGKVASCQDCGARLVNPKAKRCWPCWSVWRVGRTTRKRIHSRICESCGGPVRRADAKQCRACYHAARRLGMVCIDCGVKLDGASRNRPRERCRPCYVAFRATKTCTLDTCSQPFYAKGMCRSHYLVSRRVRLWGNKVIDRVAHTLVGQQPCTVCGYTKMKSEVHRPIAKGPYIIGNMVPLCSRCHDEVERGLTPCPPPWQPDLSQKALPL